MPTQGQYGKAFEFALINEANNLFTGKFKINIVQDATYNIALACYNLFPVRSQARYSAAAVAALTHIVLLEPRLVNPQNATELLTLQLQPDSVGRLGDVRDILFIRSSQNWEIGISAKNNHKALKHSRLSDIKDFGLSWLGVPCSPGYWAAISPVFKQLAKLRDKGEKWKNLPNKHAAYYRPVLDAFMNELILINASNPGIPQKLISYLVGNNDFFKVMKRAKIVEILAFNLKKSLGKSAGSIRSITTLPKLALPTQIIRFQMRPGSTDTLEMVCDKGWQLSFRIHSAETDVAASLKFDVNLIGQPVSMYAHNIPY